jgi:hypothetical protein
VEWSEEYRVRSEECRVQSEEWVVKYIFNEGEHMRLGCRNFSL